MLDPVLVYTKVDSERAFTLESIKLTLLPTLVLPLWVLFPESVVVVMLLVGL